MTLVFIPPCKVTVPVAVLAIAASVMPTKEDELVEPIENATASASVAAPS